MTESGSHETKSPSELIDGRIEELGDWRGEMLSHLRDLDQGSRIPTSSRSGSGEGSRSGTTTG